MATMPIVEEHEQVALRRRRTHITHLREEKERIEARFEVLKELHARTCEELEKVEREERESPEGQVALAEANAEAKRQREQRQVEARREREREHEDVEREQRKAVAATEADVRDAAVRLRTFTPSEIAAILQTQKKTVVAILAGLCERGTVKSTGQKFYGQMVYEYVVPVEAGDAFELQQQVQRQEAAEQRKREAQVARERGQGGLISGGVGGTGGSLLDRLDKQVRIQCRKAVRDGWSLAETGDGHFKLEKEGFRSIPVAGTPRVPAHEAEHIAQHLKRPRPKLVSVA